MHQKATHKLRTLGNAPADIMASATSMTEAARQLGVNRSTLHRWIVAGKVPGLTGGPGRGRVSEPAGSADEWAAAIASTYPLTATGQALLELAKQALTIARDVTAAAGVRLTAMGRYQQLVRQIGVEEPAAEKEPAAPKRDVQRRTGTDPRGILSAAT